MKIPEDTRSFTPNLVVGYRRPRSTIEAEKYAFKAAEKGHERQMASYENDRIARTINFVGNLTQTAIAFADKLIENEAARQLSNAEVTIDQRFYDIKKDLADNPYEQQEVIGAGGIASGAQGPKKLILRHEKVWSEAKEKIKDEVLKDLTNPRAKKIFEARYEKVAQEFGHELQNDARSIMMKQQKVDLNNNIEYWISKGRMDKVDELLSAGRVTGLYNPEEIDKIADYARTAIAYEITKSYTTAVPFEQGLEFLNNPDMIDKLLRKNGLSGSDLTEESREKLKKKLETELKLAKQQQAERDRQIFEQEQERLDRANIPAVSGGEGDKMWWQGKLDARLKADEGAAKTEAKHKVYNAEYDRMNNAVKELIEAGETDRADEILDQIQKSKLKESDQGILTSKINNWRKGIEEDIRIDEYLDAKEKIENGEITKIGQISNSKKYEHLSLADIKSLESSLKTKIKADNPNYISDQDKKAQLDRMILQGRKEEALDFLRKNIGADKDGNPGISLKEAGKYKDELLKEREEAVKNATKEGIELIDSTFKQMMTVAEDPKDKFDIETAQKRIVTKYREMIIDDMEPAEVVQKAKDMLDVENVATVSNMLEDAYSGWFGKKKREQAMEAVKAMGLNDAEIAKQDFKEFMGAEPGRVGKDKEGNTIVQYNNDIYGLIDGVWKIWSKDKEKWLKYRK